MAENSTSPDLWRPWLREHGSRLLLFARQQAGAEAEDVFQEALVRIWKENPPEERRLPALYQAIRRIAIDRGRSRTRRHRREEIATSDPALGGNRPWFAATGASAAEAKEIQEAVEDLPTKEREVVVLRIWGGLGFREIGEALSVPTATASTRYRSALEKLRDLLEIDPERESRSLQHSYLT